LTGGKDFALVSEETVVSAASKKYAAHLEILRQHGKLIDSGPSYLRVASVSSRIIQQAILMRPDSSGWDWQVAIEDDPNTANALGFPGGKLLVYSGLLYGLDLSDDELSQIMGHEVAHALLGHGRELKSLDLLSTIVTLGIVATVPYFPQGAERISDMLWKLPMRRAAESEADRLGIELAARAGYDPTAAVSVWEKMMAAHATSSTSLDFWSSHPATPKRIETFRQIHEAMQVLYVEAQEANAAAAE
jgi:predicted Zn-dependent protease